MRPTAPPARRTIHDASAALDQLLSQAQAMRQDLAGGHLPIPAAVDRMDYSDELVAILISQIRRAASIVGAAARRAREADEIAFARAHGVIALSEDQRVDADFTRWTNSLRGAG